MYNKGGRREEEEEKKKKKKEKKKQNNKPRLGVEPVCRQNKIIFLIFLLLI